MPTPWLEEIYVEKCPLCEASFDKLAKKCSMVAELGPHGQDRFFRVCNVCDSIYSLLNNLRWEKE